METKVVEFPRSKPTRRKLIGDEKIVDDVRKAWRALGRAVKAAENAGLHVTRDFNIHADLRITRTYK